MFLYYLTRGVNYSTFLYLYNRRLLVSQFAMLYKQRAVFSSNYPYLICLLYLYSSQLYLHLCLSHCNSCRFFSSTYAACTAFLPTSCHCKFGIANIYTCSSVFVTARLTLSPAISQPWQSHSIMLAIFIFKRCVRKSMRL